MSIKNLSKVFATVVVLSMVLAACGTAGPDRGEFSALAKFEGLKLDAGSCDYGGKILSVEATDAQTAVFTLCRPDPAFLAKIAFTPFAIQPEEYIAQTGGTGALLDSPVGTGPYVVTQWDRGNQIVYTRNDNYWGTKAPVKTVTLRWLTESAARLQELQAGTADFISNLAPADYATVQGDSNLQLVNQANPNVFYIGFTNTFPPFDNVDVRKAIAMGIDRQRIVDNFYPAGSEVADYFTPCAIANGCEGDPWYSFDPTAAKALLAQAGFPDGFSTTIYYRDVFRPYVPEVARVAQDIQTQLKDNLGITAELVPMESGAFIDAASSGQLNGIHLLGWGGDYPHITNFLDFHFNQNQVQFGNNFADIYEPLAQAASIADVAQAAPLYAQANNAIKANVPLIPVAHGSVASAALTSLQGAYYPAFGAPEFFRMNTGDADMVYIQNAEPISLDCADETDGESLTACQQVIEPLYDYDTAGNPVPNLATSCDANADSTVWTCHLRSGVKFSDGSAFDADDVVATFSMGLDASNPYHVGNTGSFDYWSYLWDGFINPPAQ